MMFHRGVLGLDGTAVSSPVADSQLEPDSHTLSGTQQEEEIDASQPGNTVTGETGRRDRGMATNNPGMVMNELLCFCFNMLDCMAQSLLQKICVEFYNDAAIDAAREEVMKHNEDESLRNRLLRKRKGTAKKSSSMKDILDTVRSNDSSVFPVYVARSLGNMPPVTKNCVNMTSMMVELGQLRSGEDRESSG